MTTFPLGIDISELKFDACLAREGGKFRRRVFPNTPDSFSHLSAWPSKHHVERAHACLEATGTYLTRLRWGRERRWRFLESGRRKP